MRLDTLINKSIDTDDIITTDVSEVFDVRRLERYSIQSVITVDTPAAQTFLQANVNATDNTIGITAHDFTTGLKATLSEESSALPTGLTAATNYYAIVSDSDTLKFATTLANALAGTAIDLTAAGSGHAHTIDFTDAPTAFTFTADNTTEKATHASHGLWTGAKIRVSNSGGALPSPLLAATDYYAIVTGANDFKFATSRANASAGTAIDLTTNGTGTQTCTPQSTPATRTFAASSVNTTNETVDTDAAHNATTGDLLQLTAQTTGLPGGLSAQAYYVIAVDANTIKLASSLANAQAGTAVDITTTGDSVAIHTLTPDSLAGGAIKLQKSNDPRAFQGDPDNADWTDVASATSISASGTVWFEVGEPAYAAARIHKTLTAGRMSTVDNVIGKGF